MKVVFIDLLIGPQMQKLMNVVIGYALAMTAFAASAKGTPPDDVGKVMMPACMIQIHGGDTYRAVNVAYVREIEVSDGDKYILVTMASNYNNRDEYKIKYATNAEARARVEALTKQINNCK